LEKSTGNADAILKLTTSVDRKYYNGR